MRQIFPNLSLPGAAGALALLFAAAVFFGGGDAPLSVATAVAADDCTALTQTPSRRRGYIGAQPLSIASRTPENVSATCNARRQGGDGYSESPYISVSWDIPSEFPRSLLSGYCILLSHDVLGESEQCTESASETTSRMNPCRYDANRVWTCHEGTFYLRVRLTTSCDVDLPWSSGDTCSY